MQKGVLRKRNPRPLSEYGRQLAEKQSLKFQYNLRERQFARYVAEALSKSGNSPEIFMQKLETRLDNAVFRMGLAQSRPQARQLVSHGHLTLNKRPMDVPSHQVKIGDVIAVHPSSLALTYIANIKPGLKKYDAPSWLQLDKEALSAEVVSLPTLEEASPSVEISLVFEFYSR
ncbi:MAG: 30S ribosomal protein S4 [bacterium]|nr:30S ribosomal protein S4 [bacterium]